MEQHANPVFYKDLLLLLGTAGVVIPLFQRLRISPVIGYLIASTRLAGPLDKLRVWLVDNNAVIMAVLLLVIGVSVIGKGIANF